MSTIVTGGNKNLTLMNKTDLLEADVLIAPAQLEKEPIRRLLSHVIATDVMPKYASFLEQLPLPKIDLQSVGLPGIQSFEVGHLHVDSSSNSLSISSSFELITD